MGESHGIQESIKRTLKGVQQKTTAYLQQFYYISLINKKKTAL